MPVYVPAADSRWCCLKRWDAVHVHHGSRYGGSRYNSGRYNEAPLGHDIDHGDRQQMKVDRLVSNSDRLAVYAHYDT